MSEDRIQEEQSAETVPAADGVRTDKPGKEKKSVVREILGWVGTLLSAVVLALAIRSFLFELVRVDGASMNDTLQNGEIMFVSKLDYASTWLSLPWQSSEAKEAAPRLATGIGEPKQFDVVIARYPGRGDTNFVKRLIGMPGDRIRIEDGYLYVNDQKYEEPYVNDEYRTNAGSPGKDFEEIYVPKKGDELSLEYVDEAKSRVGVYVNGGIWTWRGISSEAVSEEGDRLAYHRDGALMLNGEDISSDPERIKDLVGRKFTLEKDLYFVMGDHRDSSNDSRSQGPITRDMLVGHVRTVIFPIGAWRGIQ